MSTVITVLRAFVTMPALAGMGMLAMGVGAIDVDEGMWAVAETILGKDNFPAKPVLLVLGTVKVLGALGLWGVGPLGNNRVFPVLAMGVPAACAVYGHSVVGDGNAPAPAIYLVLLSIYHWMNTKDEDKKKSN